MAHDFKAIYVKTKEEAVQEVWKQITPKQRIGVGGSLTVRGLGILENWKHKVILFMIIGNQGFQGEYL